MAIVSASFIFNAEKILSVLWIEGGKILVLDAGEMQQNDQRFQLFETSLRSFIHLLIVEVLQKFSCSLKYNLVFSSTF